MIGPRIDLLLNQVGERYALVIVAAKRARQINNYHHQLGEGTFDDFAPPLVESRSKNYLTMALRHPETHHHHTEGATRALQSGSSRGVFQATHQRRGVARR